MAQLKDTQVKGTLAADGKMFAEGGNEVYHEGNFNLSNSEIASQLNDAIQYEISQYVDDLNYDISEINSLIDYTIQDVDDRFSLFNNEIERIETEANDKVNEVNDRVESFSMTIDDIIDNQNYFQGEIDYVQSNLEAQIIDGDNYVLAGLENLAVSSNVEHET